MLSVRAPHWWQLCPPFSTHLATSASVTLCLDFPAWNLHVWVVVNVRGSSGWRGRVAAAGDGGSKSDGARTGTGAFVVWLVV